MTNKITIEALKFNALDSLKEFAIKKVDKLFKYSDMVVDADITLHLIKPDAVNNKEATVLMNLKGDQIFAKKTADTFEEAVVLCCEALEKKIKEHKDKVEQAYRQKP